ncbi:MAG: 16S rRNA (guanine(527)-N(7))-methyltransferase RsmG [Clostridiales bacterium]|nr:16S rRNA (guanine(527)-N(7))-methyltransferase RsmG [Clostridiales bacterium]
MKEILKAAGVDVSDKVCNDLAVYMDMLTEWNKVMDLTNVPAEEIPLRHFADSLLPYAMGMIRRGSSLADVGTGAGFPGLPLAIADPSLKVTLIDALQKRCDFLNAVCEKLGLRNVTVLHLRAEDAGRDKKLREKFDYAVARAVAPLNVLEEYLLPLVKAGGEALCWKGPAVRDEMEAGENAAAILGGKLETVTAVPGVGDGHCVVRISKMHPTQKEYPRKSGTPAKKPLGI